MNAPIHCMNVKNGVGSIVSHLKNWKTGHFENSIFHLLQSCHDSQGMSKVTGKKRDMGKGKWLHVIYNLHILAKINSFLYMGIQKLLLLKFQIVDSPPLLVCPCSFYMYLSPSMYVRFSEKGSSKKVLQH